MKERQKQMGTLLRDKQVYEMYEGILEELGDKAPYVTREYFYMRLEKMMVSLGWRPLSRRTMQEILNHYKMGGVSSEYQGVTHSFKSLERRVEKVLCMLARFAQSYFQLPRHRVEKRLLSPCEPV